MSFISTGGGAALELLGRQTTPGPDRPPGSSRVIDSSFSQTAEVTTVACLTFSGSRVWENRTQSRRIAERERLDERERAKRGGNPIYPRRAFLAFLVLHASQSINAGGIFQHPATFIPSITIEIPVRRPLIIGNWKMNKTASEAAAFIQRPPRASACIA